MLKVSLNNLVEKKFFLDMAYTAQGIKARLKYKVDTSEWRWDVEASGTETNEYEYSSGLAESYGDALAAMNAAITNRLA